MKAPPRAAGEDVAAIDAFVMSAVPDRSTRMQAPEPLKPTNRFGSAEESRKHFLESRSATERLLDGRSDLRAHAADSPFGKKLDAYEWILFIGAHRSATRSRCLKSKPTPIFRRKNPHTRKYKKTKENLYAKTATHRTIDLAEENGQWKIGKQSWSNAK